MPVSHALLRLLLEGPCHGYDLHHKLAVFGHFYPLSNVNVYPVLRDLEERGLVTSRRELAESRMRKTYEITQAGIDDLSAWIARAPDGSVPVQKDLVALKLVLAPGEHAELSWLTGSLAELEAEIVRSRALLALLTQRGISALARLTAEFRLRSYEHRREYLREALRIVQGAPVPEPEVHRRVLVVDDSPASRILSTHLLSAAGYEVRLAEDGARAWDLLREDEFDALVSDAIMPEIDGFELLRRVRGNPELSGLPVILNTVLEEPDKRDAALALGASDFVCKTEADAGRRLVDCVDRLTRGSAESAAQI